MEADPLATLWGSRGEEVGGMELCFLYEIHYLGGGERCIILPSPSPWKQGELFLSTKKNNEYDIFQFFMHYLELYWDKIIKLRN